MQTATVLFRTVHKEIRVLLQGVANDPVVRGRRGGVRRTGSISCGCAGVYPAIRTPAGHKTQVSGVASGSVMCSVTEYCGGRGKVQREAG